MGGSIIDADGSFARIGQNTAGKRLDENYFGKQFSHTP